MSGVRLQAGQAGSGQRLCCSLWLSEKPETRLFQARLTLSAQMPSAPGDPEDWRQGGYVKALGSVSVHVCALAVPTVMGATAVVSLTLLSKPSRPNTSSALAAVQPEDEAAWMQTAEDGGYHHFLQCHYGYLYFSVCFPVNKVFTHEGCDAAVWRHVLEQRHDLGFAAQEVPKDQSGCPCLQNNWF